MNLSELFGKVAAVEDFAQREGEDRYEWDSRVRRGLSMGELTHDEARAHRYSGGGHESNGWKPLPPALYHTTTDMAGVMAHGLKAAHELGQQNGHGLGGTPDYLSMTDREDHAHHMLDALHEYHSALTGKLSLRDMKDKAERGEGAEKPYGDAFMGTFGSNPHHAEATLDEKVIEPGFQYREEAKEKGWEPHPEFHQDFGQAKDGRDIGTGWIRPMTDDEKLYKRHEMYGNFSRARDWTGGGKKSVLFISNDRKGFAAKDPSNFGVLKLRPKPGAQGHYLPGEHEWRTGTGDAVEIDGKPHTATLTGLFAEAAREPYSEDVNDDSPATFDYHRRTTPAPQVPVGGSWPYHGQDIEPHGRYLSQGRAHTDLPDLESGSLTFQRPLRLHSPTDDPSHPDHWKQQLVRRYNGLKGKALSQAIRDDGYDGIMTHDSYGPSETVDLTGLTPKTAGPAEESQHFPQPMGRPDENSYTHAEGVHRGMNVVLPPHIHKFIHDPEQPAPAKAHLLLSEVRKQVAKNQGPEGEEGSTGGLGNYWTPSPHKAAEYASQTGFQTYGEHEREHNCGDPEMGDGGCPTTQVVVHADTPSDKHHWTEQNREGEKYDPAISWRLPVRPGAPLNIRGVSWREGNDNWGSGRKYGDEGMKFHQHSPFTRYDFAAPVKKQAAEESHVGESRYDEDSGEYKQLWDHWHPQLQPVMHRHLAVEFPSDHPAYDKKAPMADRAHAVVEHVSQQDGYGRQGKVGWHWTDDENYRHLNNRRMSPGQTPVILHAQTPPREHIEDNEWTLREDRAVKDWDHKEREVPVKRNAPVNISGVSWMDPMGRMQHHTFEQPITKRAAAHPRPELPPEQEAAMTSDDYRSKNLALAKNPVPGTHIWRGETRVGGPHSEALKSGVGMHWTVDPHNIVSDTPEEGKRAVIWHGEVEDPKAQAIPRSHPIWQGRHRSMDGESEIRLKPGTQVKLHGAYVWHGEGRPGRIPDVINPEGNDPGWHYHPIGEHAEVAHKPTTGLINYDHFRDLRSDWKPGPKPPEPWSGGDARQVAEHEMASGNHYTRHPGGDFDDIPEDIENDHYEAHSNAIMTDQGVGHWGDNPGDLSDHDLSNWLRFHPDRKGIEERHGIQSTAAALPRGVDNEGHDVELDPQDGWQHLDGSVSHDDGTTVSDHKVWMPSGRYWGPNSEQNDQRLFDGSKLRPEVRQEVLGRVAGWFEHNGYPDWREWLRVYFAGSQAAKWLDEDGKGNGDFDVLLGIHWPVFREAHPEAADKNDLQVTTAITDGLWHHANADDLYITLADGQREGPFQQTFFCNPRAWDIRELHPYAAYDVTADKWAVEPLEVAKDWGPDKLPKGYLTYADALVKEVAAIGELPPEERARMANNLWEEIHTHRSDAFADGGKGLFDISNLAEKYLDQHPDKPWDKLRQWKREAPVKTLTSLFREAKGASGADHDGVMIALVPPKSICKALAVEGGEPVDNMHVTLAYLGGRDEHEADHLESLPDLVESWARTREPLKANVGGVGTFVHPNSHVLWAAVDIPHGTTFRDDLVRYLEGHGYSISHDHGWTPHITLQYGSSHFRFMPKVEPKSWNAKEIWVCVGGHWTSFPLKG